MVSKSVNQRWWSDCVWMASGHLTCHLLVCTVVTAQLCNAFTKSCLCHLSFAGMFWHLQWWIWHPPTISFYFVPIYMLPLWISAQLAYPSFLKPACKYWFRQMNSYTYTVWTQTDLHIFNINSSNVKYMSTYWSYNSKLERHIHIYDLWCSLWKYELMLTSQKTWINSIKKRKWYCTGLQILQLNLLFSGIDDH